MPKFKKRKELVKTIAICLLVLSAVLLAGKSGYYNAISDKLQSGSKSLSANGLPAENIESFTGLFPFSVAVRPENGEMLCCRYDQEAMSLTYARVSVLLAEAMDSITTTIEETNETAWRSATRAQSAYFCFYSEIPMSLLATNLGVSDAGLEDISAIEILLSNEYGTLNLYFRDGADAYYGCTTDMGSAALSSLIQQFEGTPASFAYEDEAHKKLAPYTIISQRDYEISYLSASPQISDENGNKTIFAAFGISSKVMKSYLENNGTVFVEGSKTLRIKPDGTIAYSVSPSSEESRTSESMDIASAVNLAVGLTSKVLVPDIGDASLVLSSVYYDEDTSSYTIIMDYSANGILVLLKSADSAAEIVVQGGKIVKANFKALSFALGGADSSVLATSQAVAIADEKGGYLRLSYIEDAGGAFSCEWVVD